MQIFQREQILGSLIPSSDRKKSASIPAGVADAFAL